MPLLTNSSELPEWSELEFYSIHNISEGSKLSFKKKAEREMLFVCNGKCRLKIDEHESILSAGNIVDLVVSSNYTVSASWDSVVILVGGHWRDETGTCGIFELDKSNEPENRGDKTSYERNTKFDNHFHDCDEYWIIYSGKGIAVSEGNNYQVKRGTCIATKAGDHHDFPIVDEKIRGVWFETTLKGKKRKGHLWNHTHGS